MPFKNPNLDESYYAFENTQAQQHCAYSPVAHGNNSLLFQHTQDGCNSSYFTVSPLDNSIEHRRPHQQMHTSEDNNKIAFRFDDFMFPTPTPEVGEETKRLPFGWTIAERKRSIFEVETNIHTFGELYTNLMDLKNQLSREELDLNREKNQQVEPPFFVKRQSSSFTMSDTFTELSSRRSSSTFSPITPPLKEDDDLYLLLRNTYPDFIFEKLMGLGTSSCCCYFLHRKNTRKSIQIDKLDKAYASVIFAFAALHAILCHSESYGIFSFLNNLASDAYYTAHTLLEFDETSATTVETLVLMYQYLLLLGKEGEARNLFSLAWRHMEIIKESYHHHHLLLWMTELDWSYSITKDCPTIVDPNQIAKEGLKLKPTSSENIYLEDISLHYRIRGLYLILKKNQLSEWRSRYLKIFLYKRDLSKDYSTEDRLALRLHALYFSGMLQFHQSDMMTPLNFEEDTNNEWMDYFTSTVAKTKTQVEKSLRCCMSAALGYIQVVKLLLEEGDICQLPFMIDTLSAAYTVLYFGSKVTHKPLPQDVLSFIVRFVSNSSMIQCVQVERFVQTWNSFL